MVKAYLRYEQAASFGVVASNLGNTVYDTTGKLAVAPALEDVIVWDLKKGTQVARWSESGNKSEVSVIARSPNGIDYAVGYADGTIRIWSTKTHSSAITFNGHRSAVSVLTFDQAGSRLVSGSRDTDLIVWDVVGEVGLYRLRGHKDMITAVQFLSAGANADSPGYLVSSSKDTMLKLWDLTTQHCLETHVAHRAEIWSMDVDASGTLMVTASADAEIKAWRLDEELLQQENMAMEKDVVRNLYGNRFISFFGSVQRQSRERVATLQFHPSGQYLLCQSADKTIEMFRIRTEEEIRKKQQRRQKRQREKQRKKGAADAVDGEPDTTTESIAATDLITPYQVIRAPAKVRSADFAPVADLSRTSTIQLLVALNNNVLEVYSVHQPSKEKGVETPEPSKLFSVDLPGHRSDVRTLALSSDDELLCSASNNGIKIWNVHTKTCIRSMDCGYALCSLFLPNNKHVLVGTKAGQLELYDIASSSLVESIDAHEGAVWSIAMRPDKRGIVSGSADKSVKFWDFDKVHDTKEGGQTAPARLTLTLMRTLKMSDDVLCVRYSPDQRLVAVALLDATVKVFFHDTLKFFLSLYGHKLPVLSMDISSDSNLLVTCSADKNVKIWGLDFGDCHKSIYAHQESIMFVQFVHGTHYFFTAGKDRLVKYWDGDKFENIMKLEGHHGEVWSLAIAKHGTFVCSGSHDRSIRVWERTEEQLFLEEERERELEQQYENTLTESLEKTNLNDGDEDTAAAGGEAGAAGRQTMETLKAGERIIEALELGDEDYATTQAYEEMLQKGLNPPPPPRNPILLAMGDVTVDRFVLQTLEKVRASDLDEALLVLPFEKVTSLMAYLEKWARKEWNTPLTCRILFFLLRTYNAQIVSNRLMRTMLDSIRDHLRAGLRKQRDMLGYNLAALQHVRRDWEANHNFEFLDGSAPQENEDASAKKRKFVTV
ncbi:WD40-repeat-containing domain protein [Thamnocephalis sphaerospora]|uniref:WD40-repeat-containing domain protein n=1 Tax=Thamnocephalis sphaerospora TaxID=78915 RepID=A0A4V1IXI3_9FUNG|nr:WD40-repeat-containing domain protein [Thamnocephalis sphaerospora]|eukprot:RKP11159.1 WD40-repeat-containing domain protein [Thamnocephalis sphaerospora]